MTSILSGMLLLWALAGCSSSGSGGNSGFGGGSNIITTVAGGGVGCTQQTDSVGDGCPATSAQLSPIGIFLDPAGDLYIADWSNSRIRKVTAGVITTVAGGGIFPYCPQKTDSIGDGCPATDAALGSPYGVALDSAGNIYITDSGVDQQGVDHHFIREVAASTGIISTVVGGGGGCVQQTDTIGDGCPAINATLNIPYGITLDSKGNMYISDVGNGLIREVSASTGIIVVVAGGGSLCPQKTDSFGDGCPATSAELVQPQDVLVDSAGDLYIADPGSNRIREVAASTGIITTVVGGGTGCSQQSDNLGDGCPATKAVLGFPNGMVLDSAGNIYVADSGTVSGIDHRVVREVSASTGNIATVAGGGTGCIPVETDTWGDNCPATDAVLSVPEVMLFDSAGNLYFSDLGADRVRMVSK
jgi:sugar lactone lactonase YvrE